MSVVIHKKTKQEFTLEEKKKKVQHFNVSFDHFSLKSVRLIDELDKKVCYLLPLTSYCLLQPPRG